MLLRKLMVGVAAAAALGSVQAQVLLSEGFTNVSALSGAGWVFTNNSVAPDQPWFQGNTGIFDAAAGVANSYAAASFLSTTAVTGAVSNWLLSPQLTTALPSTVSFSVRVAGSGFLDTLQVRQSTNSGSFDTGATTTSVGDFTTLLTTFSSSTDTGWQNVTANIPAGFSGRIGFRYLIADVATAGNYLGMDSLTVTAVPEPATYALFALGVAGILFRRRFSA